MSELILSVSAILLISALCSLLEAVLYAVPIGHIESLSRSGRTSGRILQNLRLKNIDRPISAILSLNTIANTGGAFIAGTAFIKLFGEEWEPHFMVGITLAVLIFSEIIPKTLGVVYNRPLSSLIAFPLQFLVWVMTPLVVLCRLVTRLISKKHTDHGISEDELIVMARLGQRSGNIEPDETRLMQNILSLKRKTVMEAMTPRTVTFALNSNLTVEEAHKEAGIWSYSRVPVYDNDFEDIVGVVLRRDAFSALAENRSQEKLSSLMNEVHFVSEAFTLDRVLQMFLERRQHLFVVIDEYGGLAGILTLEDILEEILGKQIIDEFDPVTNLRELAHRRRQQVLKNR